MPDSPNARQSNHAVELFIDDFTFQFFFCIGLALRGLPFAVDLDHISFRIGYIAISSRAIVFIPPVSRSSYFFYEPGRNITCLLYTSDAADD